MVSFTFLGSLRVAPPAAHPTSTSNTTASKLSATTSTKSKDDLDRGAPSAPGLHDTLRASLYPQSTASTQTVTTAHPLESRLANWQATQEATRLQILRRNFGIAEPLRRGMELKLVRDADSFRPSVLGRPAAVHEEILTGRDAEITWEDVYAGQDGMRLAFQGGDGQGNGWMEEMERKVGMGKW
ncbi:Proteasome maturation factor UMP1 [Fonsecaea pedrosoi]|nr:Proteasome maturation factor UMP1 [Fonsecaea pedrosoi]